MAINLPRSAICAPLANLVIVVDGDAKQIETNSAASVAILDEAGVGLMPLLECTNLYPSRRKFVSRKGKRPQSGLPEAVVGFSGSLNRAEMALASVALGACIWSGSTTDTAAIASGRNIIIPWTRRIALSDRPLA